LLLTALLIVGLACACYWPALHGGLVWDDDGHVTKPSLRSAAGLWRIWSDPYATQQYYPLLHSAFWIEYRLWGAGTLGYHVLNVLLHAAASYLLFLVLRRLGLPGAALAGVLFAVHPVCVESVAWISEQKNTLSLVFYLLAANAYLRFDEERERGGWRYYLLASLLFVAALLTKTVTATLPAALLVVFWWKRGRLSLRDVWLLFPWFVVGVTSGLFTALVERRVLGAEGAEFDLTMVQRCLLAGRVIWFYAGKLVWPTNLMFIYPRWDAKSAASWAGYLAAAMAATGVLWIIRRRARGPLAAWLFFVGSLFPALGFFNVYPFIFSYVADHFQYQASMGLIAAAAAGAWWMLERAGPAARALGVGIVAALVTVLAVMSHRQSAIYVDKPTLYLATIARNPDCWMAHSNLGTWYEDLGEPRRAAAEYDAALRLMPGLAEVHYNLACALDRIPGRSREAIDHYEEALRLKPDYPDAHYNLGRALEREPGRLGEAIAQYRAALRQRPDFAEAHYSLGSDLQAVPGKINEAIAHYEQAIRLRPDFFQAHYNLGFALGGIPGREDEAIVHYREALRLRPDSAAAHFDLGCILQRTAGRMDEAVAQYRDTLRLDPDNVGAHVNLGNALSSLGRFNEAETQFSAASRLRPGDASLHLGLAITMLRNPGRADDAAAQLREVLRLDPGNRLALQLLSQVQAILP
jgi:tetratricopeptide (TPR) repeat protein